jgi:hypothetical protein
VAQRGRQVPGAARRGARYPATSAELPLGSVLALYTDGLVEQPGQDIGAGMSRLARALAAGPARSLDQLGDSVLASPPGSRDDLVSEPAVMWRGRRGRDRDPDGPPLT